MNPLDPTTAKRRTSPLTGLAGFDPSTATIGFDPVSARAEENKPWTSDLGEIGRQLVGGFAVGVPQQAGQALQWASEPGKPLYETGKRWAQAAEQRAPQWEPDLAGRGPIAETLIKGAQQVGPSVAGPLAATALLAASPVEVPAAVGLGVGALAGAVPMGMAQGQETYENVLKAGGTPEEALQAGRINQFIETAGETAGNVALGGMLGAGRRLIARSAKPVAEAVKSVTDRSVVKPFLRSTGEALITEPTTEFGQNYGEAAVEQAYGVPNLDPWQQGIEGAKVALGMTALGLPVGAVGHTVQSRRNAAIGEALSNPEVAPERRTRAAEILAGQVDQVDQKAGAAVRANAAEAIASGMPLPIDERIADPKLFLQPQETAQPGPLADAAAIAQQTGASAQAVLAGMPAGANDEQRAAVPAAGAAGGGPAAGTTGNRGRAGTATSGERAGGDGFSLGAGAPAEPAPAASEGGLGVPALVDRETGEILSPAPAGRAAPPRSQKTGLALERPRREPAEIAAQVRNLFGRVDLGLERVADELAATSTSPTLERMRAYLSSNLTPYLGEKRSAPFIEQLIVGADRDALAQELVQAIGRGRAATQEKTDVTQSEKARAETAAAPVGFDPETARPFDAAQGRPIEPAEETMVATNQGLVAPAPAEGVPPVVAKPRLEPEAQNVPPTTTENQPPPAAAVPAETGGPDQQRLALGAQVPITAPAEEEPARPTAAGAQTPAAQIPPQPEITHALEDTETGAAHGGRGAQPTIRQEGRRPGESGEGVQPGGQGREIAPEQAPVARPVGLSAHEIQALDETVPSPIQQADGEGLRSPVSHGVLPGPGIVAQKEQTGRQKAEVQPPAAQAPLAFGVTHPDERAITQQPAGRANPPGVAPTEEAARGGVSPVTPENRPPETPAAQRIEPAPGVPITQKPRLGVSFTEGDKENTFFINGNADEIQATLRAAKAPPGTKVDDTTVRLNNLARPKAEAVLLPPKGEPIEQGQNQAPQAPIGKAPEPEAEPWQIRRGEFEARPPERIQREGHEYLLDGTRKVQKYIEQGVKPEAATEIPPSAVHREQVMRALTEGRQVPEDVLADYPEMRRPAPAPEDVTAAWQDEGRKAAIEGRPRLAAQHPGEFIHPDNEAAWLRGYDEAKQPAQPPAAAVLAQPTEPPHGQEETPTEALLTSPEKSSPVGATPRKVTEGDVVSWQRFGRKVTARVAKAPDFEGMMDVEVLTDKSRKMKPGFRLRQHAANVTFEGPASPPSQASPIEGEGVSAVPPADIETRMVSALSQNRALVEIGKGSQRSGNFDAWQRQSLAPVAWRWLVDQMQTKQLTPEQYERYGNRLQDPEYTARLGRQVTGQETAAVSPSSQPSPIRGEGATGATGLLDTRTVDAETGRTHLLAGGHIVSRWGNQGQFQEEEWAEESDRGQAGKTWVRKTRTEGGVMTSGPGPLEAWSKERVVDQIVRARKWGTPEAQGQTPGAAPAPAETVTTAVPEAQNVPESTKAAAAPKEKAQAAATDMGEFTQPASGPWAPTEPEPTEQGHGHPEHTTTGTTSPAGDAGQRAAAVPGAAGERPAGGLPGEQGPGNAGGVRPAVRPGMAEDHEREGQLGGSGAHPTGNLAAATDLGRDTGELPRISRGDDYRIQPDELTRQGSWFESARRNVEAVELIARLDKEKRAPTKEEQAQLAQFVGWGPGEIRNNLFPPEAGIGKEYRPYYARGEQWKGLGERVKEIFSDEDWKTVARSTQYAHYTSEKVIRSIYAALGRLGFTGGSVVEPGAGIGLFAGLMPDAIYRNSTYLGIELDGFSAKIAQYLFPSQTIRHQDYTKQKLPKNFFDVAIGNPPFADVPVLSDPEYRKSKFLLHDYFFAKTLDSVRPGGLLVFITSNGTLDKKSSAARDYLSARADLLGAIRLPQTAFKENAGTEVVTDVLFLRKRDPDAAAAGPDWKDSVPIQVEGTEQFINQYYVAHPEMVLGTHSAEGKMYAAKNYTVKPLEGDIEEHFARAAQNLPQNVYSVLAPNVAVKTVQAKTIERDFNPKHRKEGGIYLSDKGDLMRVEFGAGVALADVEKNLSAKDREFLTDYIPLRDALKKAQYDQLAEGDWQASLAALNQAYDAFIKRHGPVNAFKLSERKLIDEDGTETVVAVRTPIHEKRLRMDVEFTLLSAVETIKEDGTIEKGPVLKDRVLKQPAQPKIETISDALAVSLANTGVFNIDHVAQLYGVTRPEALDLLGDLVYQLPSGGYAMADAYLSGDVKEKLDEAVIAAQHDSRFRRNVEALQKAQPPVLGAGDITVQLGAAWIPERYVSQFGQDVLGINGAQVRYAKATGQWGVSGRAGKIVSRTGSAEWGTPYRSPTELLDSVLNHRQIRIYDTIEEGGSKKSVFNEKATVIANDLAKRMADEFSTWVWTDSRRASDLLQRYNETFNRYSPREFNGDHLNPPGLSLKFKLHPHQKRAVWRQIQDGNVYLAHAVGAGKAQPLDAKVLTPDGWRCMGDLAIGDFVIAGDGTPTRITGVYPQGVKDIFQVQFSDGAATECCDEHLWLTQTYAERSFASKAKRLEKNWLCAKPNVRALSEIRATLTASHLGAKNHSIPIVGKVHFNTKAVPLDPYLVGVLLGDGGLTGSSVYISKSDAEIRTEVAKCLPVDCEVAEKDGCTFSIAYRGKRLAECSGHGGLRALPSNPVKIALTRLGLWGRRSYEKFIPVDYLFNAPGVRIDLLQGLMDTDGWVDRRGGSTYYTTSSPQLADDLTALVQSLGGTVKRSVKTPEYTYLGQRCVGRIAYNLCLNLPTDIHPFRLSRKAELVKPKSKYLPTRYIIGVEAVGRKAAQCIAVEHPSRLYVTDDFIVTHNTLEMIIGGMEQKRLGLIKKPMYAVPNHMLQQFAREIMEAYPAANILVADEQNFHTDNRRRFMAQAAFNAPDAIVITHSAFKLLQLKPENKAKAYNTILDELREQLEEVDDSDQIGKRTRREIEKRIERLEQQLEGKSKSETKDTALYFEDMGVDYLYVDEAHAYRKLDFATNMKVKGLSPEGSQQSLDMYAKTRWLDGQRPGRAFTFASGTPITNSMAEMYTVQKFFQEDLMRKEGLHHFDAWASQFGRVAKFYERNATGGIEVVERFGKFVNVYDMMSRALEFMDSLTSPQLAELIKLPDVHPGNAGRRELISVDQSQNLADYLAGELSTRLEASRKWKPTRDEPNNPDPVIAIIGDGRLAAIDFRFVDPSLPNDPGSKLNRMVDEIIRIHKETADLEYTDPETGEIDPIKGATQIVFASNGFGDAVIRNRGFDSRAWVMKRLKAAGISAQDVAWIWDYKDASKKEALFKEMRQGKKRILIGSPKNMGTGVNVQRRLLALHHLDAPWYPSDLEQPEGRIVRQGNQNPEVQIYGYATDGTYDSTMWTMVAQKSGFIEQAFKGDRRLRTMDDVSESSQYALAAAIASGDQRYMKLAELEADVTRLEAIRKAHDNRQLSLKRDISNAERDLEWHRKLLETARAVARALTDQTFYSGYLNGKIGDSVFQRGKTTEVGDAMLQTFNRAYDAAVLQVQQKAMGSTAVVRHRIDQQVGMLNRVTLRVVGDLAAKQNTKGDIELLSLRSEFDLEASVGNWEIGRLFGRRHLPQDGEEAASKLLTAGREAGYRPPRLERAIGEIKQKLDEYRGRFGAPFAQEQEYLEKLAELEALRKELTGKEEPIDPAAVGDVRNEDEAEGEAVGETGREIQRENEVKREAGGETREEGFGAEAAPTPLYSKPGAGEIAVATTHEPATLRIALQGALEPFGRDFGHVLLSAPWMHVITAAEIPPYTMENEVTAKFGRGGRPVAMYSPDGQVYLVADRIRESATGADLRGLVLHEIAVHAKHLGQKSGVWKNILKQFDAMEQSGNPEIRAAYRRAMLARVPKEMLQEEALAYFIEAHPDLPFAKRVLAWFRAVLRKIGDTFQGLNRQSWIRWANTLTAEDLVAMAQGALRGVMSDVRVRRIGISKPAFSAAAEPGATTPEIRYSQSPTENPENVFADIDKIIANETPWKEQAKKITERWETLKGAFKRQWLGALSVRQLAEVGKGLLPGIHEYVDHMQGMAATRTQIFDIADKIAKDWGTLVPGNKQGNRIEQNRLAAVMHEATIAGVDPAEPYVPSIDIPETAKKIGVLRAQMRSRSGENQSERMAQVASLRQQIAFENRRKEAYEPLRNRFLALTERAQKIYRRARDYHVDQSHRVEQALVDMIEQSQLSGKAKAEAIGKLRKEFESNRVQAPYFPLSRFGDYWVFVKPEGDGSAEFHMFQTVEQQERFIEEERKAGAKILGRGKQAENLREVVGVSTGFVAEVENLLATMGKDPIVQAARDQVYQLYLATLPDLSVRKHFIHRKKTPGFGQDALRAFAEKAYHDAYQYARLKHGLALRQTMEDLRADIEAANRPAKRRAALQELERLTEFRDTVMGRLTAQEVKNRIVELEGRALEQRDLVPLLKKWQQFGEWMDDWARRGGMPAFVERRVKVLERRLETGDRINAKERGYEFAANVFDELQAAYGQLMNPRTSPIANMVNQLGFTWFLGFSPSAWLVNGMQTPMVSVPYAAAKFGFAKTAAAFSRAYRSAFKPDAENLFSIRGSLQGEELKAYDEAVEIGLIDRTRAHDLAGLAEEGTQRSGLNRKLMELASAGFHHAERLNREVTFIAGFELARESGMDYAEAMAYAQELVWKTHLDYAAENRPRLLRGNVARVIGQFKLYSQGITYLLGKAFTDALNRPGVSVETRKEARRFLAMQFGLQFAAAGALGLPVGAALMVAKAMLSGDDDDPEDFEGLFRQAMADWTGSKTAGTAVSTGLFNALTPIDLHSRLSMADLWLREPDRQLEGRDAAYWVMTSILGPMAGLVESGLVGAKLINDGQLYRGIEKMLPNALNDAAKGIRYATEGAQTLKGDKLLREVTPAESLFQVLGFTPARLESRYAENQARKNVEQRIQDRRSQLVRMATEARMAQDREAIVDTNEQIRAFNQKNPARRILGTDIAQSIRSRARYRAQAESGAILNPRLRRELTERYSFAPQ